MNDTSSSQLTPAAAAHAAALSAVASALQADWYIPGQREGYPPAWVIRQARVMLAALSTDRVREMLAQILGSPGGVLYNQFDSSHAGKGRSLNTARAAADAVITSLSNVVIDESVDVSQPANDNLPRHNEGVSAQRVDTDAIRAREKAATAGPWAIEPHDHIRKGCICMCCLSVTGWGLTHRTSCEEVAAGPRPHVGSEWPPADPCDEAVLTYEDAEFIAHARTDIPTLLAEVDRLREALRRVVEAKGEVLDRLRLHWPNQAFYNEQIKSLVGPNDPLFERAFNYVWERVIADAALLGADDG